MSRAPKSRTDVLVAAVLALLVLAQTGVLYRRLGSAPALVGPAAGDPAEPPLRIGEHLDSLVLSTPEGPVVVRGDGLGGDTLTVLAFHSGCPFCDSIGALWRDWMRVGRHRVIALTREPLDSALAYARAQEWDCLVGTLVHGGDSLRLGWMTSRTPWFFSFGPDGRLVRAGHGEEVDPGSLPPDRILAPDQVLWRGG